MQRVKNSVLTTPKGQDVRIATVSDQKIEEKKQLIADLQTTADEELVGNNPDDKNWKGIGLALLVIAVVLALVVTASVLVIPDYDDRVLGERIDIDHLFNKDLSPKLLQAAWVGPDTYVSRDEDGSVVAVDLVNNGTTFIMDNNRFRQLNTEEYTVSADLKFVLLVHDVIKINSFTRTALYKIYDKEKRKLVNLPVDSTGTTRLTCASWGPNGNSLVYVRNNALYHQANVYTEAKNLTDTDSPTTIRNAIPDWLYEEEILRRDHAFWWSPGGSFVAYAIFDDTEVPLHEYPYYGDELNVAGQLKSMHYPKAGDFSKNPQVALYVMDVPRRSKAVRLKPPSVIDHKDHYLVEVAWKSPDKLAVTWMNRAQNLSMVMLCFASSEVCVPNLRETTREGVPWLEMNQKPFFTPADGKYYFLALPQQDGVAGYYQHVAMVTANTNQEGHRTFLTHGQWEVTEVVGYDKAEQSVYVIGTYDSPLKRRLLKVGTTTSAAPKKVTCLTCDFNDTCTYASAKFSPSGRYYFLSCLGPDVPRHYLKSTSDPGFVVTIDDNKKVKAQIDLLALPPKSYHSVKLTDEINATMRIYLPPALNLKHIIEYPALLYIGAGPNEQSVDERFQMDIISYFTSGQAVIVAVLDGRGTKARGGRYKQALHKNLGKVDVEDQTAAIKYLSTLPYVDRYSIGVYGWGYGGFVAAHLLAKGNELLHCGVIGAPVADYRYYDSAFSEKFMGVPTVEDNLAGYQFGRLMDQSARFYNTNVLILHGTGDEKVHFQNTAHFMKSLTEAKVQFQSQIYPDERHSFTQSSQRHMYRLVTNFLNNCFANATSNYVSSGREEPTITVVAEVEKGV